MQVYSTHTVLLHTTLFDRKRFIRPLIKQTEYLVIYVQHEKIVKDHYAFWVLEPHLTSKEQTLFLIRQAE